MPEPPTEHPHATALRWACESLEKDGNPEAVKENLRQLLTGSDELKAAVVAALADYEDQRTGDLEKDGQLALSLIARALGAPALRPASTWKGQPPPEPILWRDYGDDDNDNLSPVLSVGEVCLLSAAGGLGKSTVTVALAAAAATAEEGKYGAACGLRVRCGPVVLLSYEDSPARVTTRLQWYDRGPALDRVHVVEDPVPLWETTPKGPGAGERCAVWPAQWEAIRDTAARLVVIDPASVACLAPVAEAPAVRAFLSACMAEAQARDGWPGCGVLIVAHSTKAARDAMQGGDDPGAGVVAGSAAWHDAARGVLTLHRGLNGAYLLHCVKSNYGQVGWGQQLREHYVGGSAWRGLRADDGGAVHRDKVPAWLKEHHPKHRDRRGQKNGDDDGDKGDDEDGLTPEAKDAIG